MTTPTVKTATASDEGPVIDVVVLAFSADPAARWTWADPQQYLRHFPRFAKAFGGQAFTRGSAYYIDGYAGAALWLPPDIQPDEEALMTLLQSTASGQSREHVSGILEQMGNYHPSEPHWYLPLMVSTRFTRVKDWALR